MILPPSGIDFLGQLQTENMKLPSNFFSGLSGVVLPVPKYRFPPEFQKTSRLTYYATLFNSIEVNSSFYKIPKKTTVERWTKEVPEHFRFTFKLFRNVTHCKDLTFDQTTVREFLQTISHVGNKRGCLLVQFPPALKHESIGQLENLLNCIQESNDADPWRLAVEFRDKSWYNDEVYSMFDFYNCSIVRQDIPKSATPFNVPVSDFVYLRFHGPTGNYRDSYSDSHLAEYADYVNEWLRQGKTVYVYFNNTAGEAFQNLITFNEQVYPHNKR